jgi:hypothetical protein
VGEIAPFEREGFGFVVFFPAGHPHTHPNDEAYIGLIDTEVCHFETL